MAGSGTFINQIGQYHKVSQTSPIYTTITTAHNIRRDVRRIQIITRLCSYELVITLSRYCLNSGESLDVVPSICNSNKKFPSELRNVFRSITLLKTKLRHKFFAVSFAKILRTRLFLSQLGRFFPRWLLVFIFLIFFFSREALHASLNTHYIAWNYKKKKKEKMKSIGKMFRENPEMKGVTNSRREAI